MNVPTRIGRLTLEWCLIDDVELDWKFTISPRSGRLIALPPHLATDHVQSYAALQMHGLRREEERAALACDDSAQGPVGSPGRPRGILARSELHLQWALCATLARVAPLRTALSTLARLPIPREDRSPASILDDVASIEHLLHPVLHTRQCLPRAMLRFWMLLCLHSRVEFNLGIWVPTERMHAWASLESVPFGEEREEVMHYRPCVRMTWTSNEP